MSFCARRKASISEREERKVLFETSSASFCPSSLASVSASGNRRGCVDDMDRLAGCRALRTQFARGRNVWDIVIVEMMMKDQKFRFTSRWNLISRAPLRNARSFYITISHSRAHIPHKTSFTHSPHSIHPSTRYSPSPLPRNTHSKPPTPKTQD